MALEVGRRPARMIGKPCPLQPRLDRCERCLGLGVVPGTFGLALSVEAGEPGRTEPIILAAPLLCLALFLPLALLTLGA